MLEKIKMHEEEQPRQTPINWWILLIKEAAATWNNSKQYDIENSTPMQQFMYMYICGTRQSKVTVASFKKKKKVTIAIVVLKL